MPKTESATAGCTNVLRYPGTWQQVYAIMLIGYSRVSNYEQETTAQVPALEEIVRQKLLLGVESRSDMSTGRRKRRIDEDTQLRQIRLRVARGGLNRRVSEQRLCCRQRHLMVDHELPSIAVP
jgi:hypothetical protein